MIQISRAHLLSVPGARGALRVPFLLPRRRVQGVCTHVRREVMVCHSGGG